MNWDAFGAIAEFGGAIAVVVSLLYLAAQVRHNTRAVQGATAHSGLEPRSMTRAIATTTEAHEHTGSLPITVPSMVQALA